MDCACGHPSELDPALLRATFGLAGLRKVEAATAYVCRALRVAWDGKDVDHDACARLQRLLVDAAERPWAALLQAYVRHLDAAQGGKRCAPRTRLAYLRAAVALLPFAAADGRKVPTLRDVQRLLWRKPGLRASLCPFLSWLSTAHAAAFDLPRRAKPNRKARERRVLDHGTGLTAALEGATGPAAGKALLAACLSALLGMPLERILTLRREDFAAGDGLILRIDGLVLDLPERLRPSVDRWIGSDRQGLAFPGRSGVKPLSTSSVLYHVRQVTSPRAGVD